MLSAQAANWDGSMGSVGLEGVGAVWNRFFAVLWVFFDFKFWGCGVCFSLHSLSALRCVEGWIDEMGVTFLWGFVFRSFFLGHPLEGRGGGCISLVDFPVLCWIVRFSLLFVIQSFH